MKNLPIVIITLCICLLLTLSCTKKEDYCKSPDRKYCYRELTTHNTKGCTYISPCNEQLKQQFQNLCPSGYEVIWNP